MVKQVELTGIVPITITVDLETRAVLAVRVWDEEVRLDPPPHDTPGEWVVATAIADEVGWPAWEFGA
jgi:hypothetical protein